MKRKIFGIDRIPRKVDSTLRIGVSSSLEIDDPARFLNGMRGNSQADQRPTQTLNEERGDS